MEIVIVALLAVLLLAVVWAIVELRRATNKQTQFDQAALTAQLNEGVTRALGERLDSNLSQLAQAAGKMLRVGEEVSDLWRIMRSPKLRGGMGEMVLNELLSQVLTPNQYALQYQFKDSERVDAVVRLGKGMVPVDSKFPVESFERLVQAKSEEEEKACRKDFRSVVRKHISDTAKYIRPDEGTFDFALMYVPSENIYYEAFIKDDLIAEEGGMCSFALARRVIPVSPNSFYAYLQAIALGLKGMRVEESAREIIGGLSALRTDMEKFQDDSFRKLGEHIRRVSVAYDESSRRLGKIDTRLDKLLASGEDVPRPEGASDDDRESVP